ncbi:hypothetical protein Ahy_B09g095759 isoform G [Arachis hypogaea]|uniref:Uncharacterized protein n=1 Tax=Arachis hypogaea TaxID=3818 RepID=A0A444XG43_ARAHY|nr:hypothetical protein Ahy_B09g095759 isoform G [Arachis hypogaea]
MRIKRKEGSGRWYVSRFVEEHNHELAYGKLVDYLRSHRKISEVEVAQLTSMREIGISIPKIYESFAAQLGGFNLVTFTKQDMYNEIRKQRGEMFLRYRDSLKRCVCVRICEFDDSDNPHAYTLQKYRRPEMNWKVYRDHISNRFTCSCMRMESFGIPCVHILSVCVRLDLVEIPESLVLRRWSKAAKLEIHNQCGEQHTAEPSVTYRTRLGAFSQLCKRLGRVACMSDEDFKVYSNKLMSDALFLEIKYGLRPLTDNMTTANDCGVKDPIRVRTKGTARMSQAGGSAPKTKRKCSTCGKLGHRRTRCPNGGAQPSTRNKESLAGRNKRKRTKVTT